MEPIRGAMEEAFEAGIDYYDNLQEFTNYSAIEEKNDIGQDPDRLPLDYFNGEPTYISNNGNDLTLRDVINSRGEMVETSRQKFIASIERLGDGDIKIGKEKFFEVVTVDNLKKNPAMFLMYTYNMKQRKQLELFINTLRKALPASIATLATVGLGAYAAVKNNFFGIFGSKNNVA